jgi:hypothetical protein
MPTPLNPTTPAFLHWLGLRLVHTYGESENVDFVLRLRHEEARALTLRTNLSKNEATYYLADTGTAPGMDGTHTYVLSRRGAPGAIGSTLNLTPQQASDLSRQLDAAIDYYND